MKLVVPLVAAVASLVPTVALACPYASNAAGCGACGGSSLLSYGAWLLLGLGIGVTSVSFGRRQPS
jgi:hypothetical protein